tara:strand:- start:96 stop:254 length:159 start_codon:yes stop_codon:yes gene_type:complete
MAQQAPFFPDVGRRDESAAPYSPQYYPGDRSYYPVNNEEKWIDFMAHSSAKY